MRCTSLTYHLVKGHFLQVQQGSWNKRTKHLKYKFLIKGYRNYMEHSAWQAWQVSGAWCKIVKLRDMHMCMHTHRDLSPIPLHVNKSPEEEIFWVIKACDLCTQRFWKTNQDIFTQNYHPPNHLLLHWSRCLNLHIYHTLLLAAFVSSPPVPWGWPVLQTRLIHWHKQLWCFSVTNLQNFMFWVLHFANIWKKCTTLLWLS